jgi:putative aldouronate transport system permease protein
VAIKSTAAEKLFNLLNILFMLSLMAITVYPLYYVIIASLSDPRMLMKHEGPLWTILGQLNLTGYAITLNNPNIAIGFKNTFFYVIVGTSMNLLLTSFAAFVLTRRHFYIRNFMMKMLVITMFFSGGLIPLFFVVRTIGIYDTGWAIILPYMISTYNVIIMRTFFQSIPESMEESAIIDGANDFQVYLKIIMPLSKPVLAVIALYYGVSHWNSWFSSVLFLRNRELYPLQMFLREILILNSSLGGGENPSELLEASFSKELVKYCTIVISTVPILFVYPFLQKYFVKGVMIGALKG